MALPKVLEDLFASYNEFVEMVERKAKLGERHPHYIYVDKRYQDEYLVKVKPHGEQKPIKYLVGKAQSKVTGKRVICVSVEPHDLGTWDEGLKPEDVKSWLDEKIKLLEKDIQGMEKPKPQAEATPA